MMLAVKMLMLLLLMMTMMMMMVMMMMMMMMLLKVLMLAMVMVRVLAQSPTVHSCYSPTHRYYLDQSTKPKTANRMPL